MLSLVGELTDRDLAVRPVRGEVRPGQDAAAAEGHRLTHDRHRADVDRGRVDVPVRVAAVTVRTVAVGVDDRLELEVVSLHEPERPAQRPDALGVARSDPIRIGRGVRERRVVRHPQLPALRAIRGREAHAHLTHRLTVAVLVEVVVVDVGPHRVHRAQRVVTVGVVRDVGGIDARRRGARALVAVPVHVRVRVHRALHAVIRDAVAVLVVPIARLRAAGVIRAVRVVAVRAARDVPARERAGQGGHNGVAVRVAVAVAVVGGLHPLIRRPVAVVVRPVAGLGPARLDGRVAVVAVGVVGDTPRDRAARRRRASRTVPIDVAVGVVVGVGRIFVGRAVAVVVDAVADGLARAGVNRRARIVAVRARRDVPDGLIARHRRRGGAVAVDVHVGVPRALGRRADREVRVVGRAVAVLVHVAAVADFRGPRVDGRVAVVAVGPVRDVARGHAARLRPRGGTALAVAVRIRVEGRLHAFVHGFVAVVVDPIAHLGVAGVAEGGAVVAVALVGGFRPRRLIAGHLGRGPGVAVVIGVLVPRALGRRADRGVEVVGQAIAVLVHAPRVADLLRAGVDGRVAVVAVAVHAREAGSDAAGERAPTGAVVVAVAVRVDHRARDGDAGARVVAVGADVRHRGDGDVHVRHGIERADVLPIREDVDPAAGDDRLGVKVAIEADHLGGVEAGGVGVGDGGASREAGRRIAGHARGGRDRVVAIVEVLLGNAVPLLVAGGEGGEETNERESDH